LKILIEDQLLRRLDGRPRREAQAHDDIAAVIAETLAENIDAAGPFRLLVDPDPETDRVVVGQSEFGEADARHAFAVDRGAVGTVNCPLQSGPKVNLDWTPKETNNGQEARA
jgi:hypothetical protein